MSVGTVLLSARLFVDELDAVFLISVLDVPKGHWSLLAPLQGGGGRASLVEAHVDLHGLRLLDDADRTNGTKLTKHLLAGQEVIVHEIILQHHRQNAEIIEDLHGPQFAKRQSRMVDQLPLHHCCSTETKRKIDRRRWSGVGNAR